MRPMRWFGLLLPVTLALLVGGAGGASAKPAACPAAEEPELALLPSAKTVQRWTVRMSRQGPRHTGNAAHHEFVSWLERKLSRGGFAVTRDARQRFRRWEAKRWSLALRRPVDSGGWRWRSTRVAAYYPYSGSTPRRGVVGELADAGLGTPADFAAGDFQGKIALVSVPIPPLKFAIFAPLLWYLHDPELTTPLADFKRVWPTTVTIPRLNAARDAGAVGAIFVLETSPEDAKGQYVPWITPLQNLPALHVDRGVGARLRSLAASDAPPRARLTLTASEEDAVVHETVATLPGRSDEVMLLLTDTDGPNVFNENGALGVLAMAKYYASLPKRCRSRTIVAAFVSGNFHADVEFTPHFVREHPGLIEKSVAAIVPEHLGASEWIDDAQGYRATGLVEPAALFASQNPVLVEQAIEAVMDEDLRRTAVVRPVGNWFFGMGPALHNAGVPTAGYLAGPTYTVSWANRGEIDKVDPRRTHAEIRMLTRLASRLDAFPAEAIRAGDTLALGALHERGISALPAPGASTEAAP